jgi:hypothetical protein
MICESKASLYYIRCLDLFIIDVVLCLEGMHRIEQAAGIE